MGVGVTRNRIGIGKRRRVEPSVDTRFENVGDIIVTNPARASLPTFDKTSHGPILPVVRTNSNQNEGMLKRVDHEASFLAEDDTGRTYWLDVFVDVLDVGTNDNPHAERKGLREIKTRTGQFLNRLEKGKYKLIYSGRILSSTDPDAV